MLQYEQSLKSIIDQANGQLNQLHTSPITQNFQLSPISNFKIVNAREDVEKEMVLNDTYFLGKDLKDFWIKNSRGDVRSFELSEIIPKDEKDILIEKLQKQIEEMRSSATTTDEHITKEQSENVSNVPTSETNEQ
jgi:ribonuclease HII